MMCVTVHSRIVSKLFETQITNPSPNSSECRIFRPESKSVLHVILPTPGLSQHRAKPSAESTCIGRPRYFAVVLSENVKQSKRLKDYFLCLVLLSGTENYKADLNKHNCRTNFYIV